MVYAVKQSLFLFLDCNWFGFELVNQKMFKMKLKK